MRLPPPEPRDRERFLAAVAEHVPLDRVVELYLFQPIRQGGVESGVAVIAAAGAAPTATETAPDQAGTREPDATGAAETATLAIDAATSEDVAFDAPVSVASADPPETRAAGDGAAVADDGDCEVPEPRFTVFTARYRHVLKGPERGRWEVSVVAEADAPLSAVSAVVRGVQRRAGDVEPPEYMTGDALRDALGRQAPER